MIVVPPVGGDVRIDLRHVVTIQLGPATDMGSDLPPPDLERALCHKPLTPTLGLHRVSTTPNARNVTG